MNLESWKWSLEIKYEPELSILCKLKCPVCATTLDVRHRAQVLGYYANTWLCRPGMNFGPEDKLWVCSGCGVASLLLKDDYMQLERETASLTLDWLVRVIWDHPDFPGSQYAERLSKEAAEYHQKWADRRAEALRIANRSAEEVEADRKWREEHRWCWLILGEGLERAEFYPAFEFRCADCGAAVYRKGYAVGKNCWNGGSVNVCRDCAEKRVGCECQTTERKLT